MIPKFRCFDKKYKKIMKVNEINFEKSSVWIESDSGDHENRHTLTRGFDEVILMQSTGLFDKHGVEIFEGSVVKHSDGEYSYIGYVDRDCYVFWIRGIDPDDNFNFEDISDTSTGIAQLEVIGDMYSNPELLEVAK